MVYAAKPDFSRLSFLLVTHLLYWLLFYCNHHFLFELREKQWVSTGLNDLEKWIFVIPKMRLVWIKYTVWIWTDFSWLFDTERLPSCKAQQIDSFPPPLPTCMVDYLTFIAIWTACWRMELLRLKAEEKFCSSHMTLLTRLFQFVFSDQLSFDLIFFRFTFFRFHFLSV